MVVLDKVCTTCHGFWSHSCSTNNSRIRILYRPSEDSHHSFRFWPCTVDTYEPQHLWWTFVAKSFVHWCTFLHAKASSNWNRTLDCITSKSTLLHPCLFFSLSSNSLCSGNELHLDLGQYLSILWVFEVSRLYPGQGMIQLAHLWNYPLHRCTWIPWS